MLKEEKQENEKRRIRSFVLRQGRMTKGQQLAFEKSWTKYGLEFGKSKIGPNELFQNKNEQFVMEIGFGNGKSLVQTAFENPHINYLGVEVHKPGVGALLIDAEKQQLENIRCINHDAIEVLSFMLADNILDSVQLFFPDPWPKKRHHKRRIVNPEFLSLIYKKLKVGGTFHMATDWLPYAEEAMETLAAFEGFENKERGKNFSARPSGRPVTKFETRGENLGHEVRDLIFEKV